MVPNLQALRNLLSLWRRWLDGRLGRGETPWRDVFALLKNLRTWGAEDRVQSDEADILAGDIVGRAEDEPIKLEMELVFRADERVANGREQEARAAILAQGGRIVARTRIAEIGYHALLVELPVRAVREIARRSPNGEPPRVGMDRLVHSPLEFARLLDVKSRKVPTPGRFFEQRDGRHRLIDRRRRHALRLLKEGRILMLHYFVFRMMLAHSRIFLVEVIIQAGEDSIF